jgi:hypothetical protein
MALRASVRGTAVDDGGDRHRITLNHGRPLMHNYAALLGSIFITLLGSFAAAYAGWWLLGFGLFILAATPVPVTVGFWLRDRIGGATGRVRVQALDHGAR